MLLDLSPAMYFAPAPSSKARLGCELAAAPALAGEKQANTLICQGAVPTQSTSAALSCLCWKRSAATTRLGWIAPSPWTLAPDSWHDSLPLHGARLTPDKPSPGTGQGPLPAVATPSPAPRYPLLANPRSSGSRPARAGQLAVQAGRHSGWLAGEDPRFRARYQEGGRRTGRGLSPAVAALVTRLYRLDNGATLQRQWQEGGCRLF